MYMKLAAFFIAVFMTVGVVHADTLLIDKLDKAEAAGPERPARGATMARVESRFGAPLSKRGAVGDPPIASWEYEDFTVFFEYDRVLHSVEKPASPQADS
jgi:hypothetical protein